VASISFHNEEWGVDYPHGQPGPGSGKWVLIQGKYYSDQNRDSAWANLWKFAARGYAAANARYTLTVNYGLHQYWRLGDLIEVLYTDPQGRVSFTRQPEAPRNYFEVESISYAWDTNQGIWRTTYTLREFTPYAAPAVTVPPTPAAVSNDD
jgi:hypothetical protein